MLEVFLFSWVIFAPLDLDTDPATQIDADPDPKPCIDKRTPVQKQGSDILSHARSLTHQYNVILNNLGHHEYQYLPL
jgi:hypothetical protein